MNAIIGKDEYNNENINKYLGIQDLENKCRDDVGVNINSRTGGKNLRRKTSKKSHRKSSKKQRKSRRGGKSRRGRR